MNAHQSSNADTHEWVTPRDILDPLGGFDLDPCAPKVRPWDCAKNSYTIDDDGLKQPWYGRVWLNPPYGSFALPFVRKMVEHKHGVLLLFCRTETKLWQNLILPNCTHYNLLAERPTFHYIDGRPAPGNCGGPMALIIFDDRNLEAIRQKPGVICKPVQVIPKEKKGAELFA